MSQAGSLNGGGSGSTGSLVLIQTQTANNSASLTFNLSNTYNNYLLIGSNIFPVSNPDLLMMKINTGSGFLGSGYQSGIFYASYSNGTGISSGGFDSTSTFFLTQNNDNSGAGFTSSFYCYLQDFTIAATNSPPKINGMGTWSFSATPYTAVLTGWNTTAAGSAVTQIQLAMDSGNISTGTFSLYGITQ